MLALALETLLPYWYVWTVAVLLAAISAGFVLRFMLPAIAAGRELAQALAMLETIRRRAASASPAQAPDLEEIATRAMRGPRLPHLWQEYVDTLHAQAGSVPGQRRWRATTLAESFFTEQALVDTPLKTEFYKHLPGILTGLGIIGTFTGLIIGLSHFDVSLDPSQAQAQLARLISSVGHAFVVSAAAITLAMLVTWIEKSLVTARYRQVEDLRQAVDGLFAAGAGEEYLERLVVASENAALQVAELRGALVTELRAVGADFLARQEAAAEARRGAAERQAGRLEDQLERQAGQLEQQLQRQSRDMAARVGTVLGEGLGEPIAAIAAAVTSVAANQGEAVNRMIAEVLGRFSGELQQGFETQAGRLGELLAQTAALMQGSAAQFAALTASMDSSGARAAEAMAGGLERALAGVEARARAQFDGLAGASQAAIAALSAQIERLLADADETARGTRASAATLAEVSVDAVRGMNAGADTLYIAASDFAKAGSAVAATMVASNQGAVHLEQAARTLAEVSASSREMLAEYAAGRESLAQMLAELKETIANARREASLTAELVDRLSAASGQLTAVQKKSQDYLASVSEVLGRAHQSFAENIERTLREANRQFHRELAQAVSLLSGAIADLGDSIDDLPAKR